MLKGKKSSGGEIEHDEDKKNRRNGTGNIVYWIMCIFLTTFTIWRGSIQCNESWNQRILSDGAFGTWQLLVNAIILVVVFFQARSCIGAGTIINMVFVGYIADFICYVANDVVQIQMNLPLRILALLLAQLMASMGVALYMVANMGIAPYDSVAIIIEKLTHQKIPFHKARILSDVVVVIIGIIFATASGAGIWSVVGIGTIINACFNGPLIQFFKTKLERFYL